MLVMRFSCIFRRMRKDSSKSFQSVKHGSGGVVPAGEHTEGALQDCSLLGRGVSPVLNWYFFFFKKAPISEVSFKKNVSFFSSNKGLCKL